MRLLHFPIRISFVFLFCLFLVLINNVYGQKVYVYNKDAAQPYFSYTNQQSPEGFVYDVFELLNKGYFDLDYIKDTQAIESGDLIYGCITKEEVPKGYYFLKLPHTLEYYVFNRKGDNLSSLNDMLNKKIIVVKNDLPYQVIYQNKASHILKVKSYMEALMMLSSGFNDCAIIPFQTGLSIIKEENLKNIDYVITPFLSFEFGIAIPENRIDIINQFESALHESIKNNEYKLIEEKWIRIGFISKNSFESNDHFLIIFVGILLFVIILLIGFVVFLMNEIEASTKDYIKEIKSFNFSPLTIDLQNPLIKRILSLVPAWMFVNDNNGNVHHISQDLLLEILHTDVSPDNLKVAHLFSNEITALLAKADEKLSNQGTSLIAQEVKLEIENKVINKWLIKYPLRIQGSNQLMFLNLFIKPIHEGDYTYRFLSPEYILNSVIDALPDLIFIKNEKGIYIGGNKAFYDFSGKSEIDIIGKTDLEIFGEEKAKKYGKSDEIVFKAGVIWEGQVWDKLHNGERVRLENVKIPLSNKKGEIFALVGISHDVTRHHKHEQELATAKDKAEESDRIKSSFLANMSHEIRTPMNSIIGFSDLLADPDLTIDQRIEIIDLIQSNGHTLIDLIDDIIDFSRIEAGQIHLKYNDFNLNVILQDAYDYAIAKRNQLNKEHLNITITIGSIEDVFMIHSDPFRLRQVLKNLMNSSIRFSTSESVFLGYLIKNEELILYIKNDNNIISDDIINKLISRETDFNYSFSDIEESAGIALIIAKNVIEMIGGQLYQEEIIPGRSDFYFAIPLKRADKIEPKKASAAKIDLPDWNDKTILIAEDEEINFMLLEGMLDKTKVNIIRANNGKEAVDLYQANASKIDLILMDIRMPELNGVDASRKILEFDAEAIILAQTAYAMPEDVDQYIKIGMKAVVSKPIDPSEFYFVCNKYLAKKS